MSQCLAVLLALALLVACGDDTTTTLADSGTTPTADSAGTTTTADTGPGTDTDPTAPDADGDGFDADDDCNDDDDQVHPGAQETCDRADQDCDGTVDEEPADPSTWYPDDDGDGYGRTDEPVEACEAPHGYAAHDGDCDDTDGRYHPGAAEDDCTVAHDYNCDGSTQYEDADGDLIPACEDCDDSDAFSFPGSPENCDGSDNDCDGDVDEEAIDATTWYGDADGDGAGGTTFTQDACEQPDGYVASADDCDDLDDSALPGGTEVCDDADNDCDGGTDEGVGVTWYADADHDGYGDPDDAQDGCDEPVGYTANDQDCDDSDPAAHPGGVEVCDGADNDCDGDADGDALDADAWYSDSDSDGYGDPETEALACEAPTDTVADDTDCDDGDTSVNPGATEVCDGADNDCDGDTDDADGSLDTSTGTTFYADADGDGHGGTSPVVACELPSGAAADSTDCDDGDAAVNTDATEICNDIDDDCDGDIDDDDSSVDTSTGATFYDDGDGDGFGDPAQASEACDAPEAAVSDGTDCDDGDPAVNPDADELCSDSTDNDCDSSVDEDTAVDATTWYADGDGDGYGDDAFSTLACEEPAGHVALGGDCDDTDTSYSPGAAQACDGTDRDCDGTVDGDTNGDGTPEGCPDGSNCADHTDCDSGYCGPTSATCVTLDPIVISALTDDYNGNMGGLSGADALCAADASAHGFSGTWYAFLSDSSHDLRDLIPDTTNASTGSNIRDYWPVEDINGTQLLSDWNTLLGGSSGSTIVTSFDGDIIEEENGYSNDADGWHGSYTDGTFYSGQTCSDWTSTGGVGVGMELDASQFLGSLEENKDCSLDYAVLCVRVED